MSKFKGTKGVWNINKHSSTTVECKGRSIATTGGYSDNSNMEQVDVENLANAKLIASAPELLEALQNANNVLKMASLIDKTNTCSEAQIICENAIKKILGM